MSFLEYAPAPESRSVLNLQSEYGLFINGEFREGNGTSFASINPADETKITMISAADEADVDAAREPGALELRVTLDHLGRVLREEAWEPGRAVPAVARNAGGALDLPPAEHGRLPLLGCLLAHRLRSRVKWST